MENILTGVAQDLQPAGHSPRTVESFSCHVKKFLEYYTKYPKQITEDEIKSYFLYLKYTKKLSGSASAQAICGIKFMFQKTLDMDFKVFGVVKNPRGRKLLFVDEPAENNSEIKEPEEVCCPVCGQAMIFIEEIPRCISARAP